MNTSEGGQQPQKAGAGAFGGHNNPVPAQFQHEDDEEIRLTTTGYRRVCDGMAASIVRLECQADELRAEVVLEGTDGSGAPTITLYRIRDAAD